MRNYANKSRLGRFNCVWKGIYPYKPDKVQDDMKNAINNEFRWNNSNKKRLNVTKKRLSSPIPIIQLN